MRPPQPKMSNVDPQNEAMLIDLSPNETTTATTTIENLLNTSQPQSQTPLNLSILDAPIDIPTEGLNTGDDLKSLSFKLEPPPYHSPPTYMNTFNTNEAETISTAATLQSVIKKSKKTQNDPFDTSHISGNNKIC